MRIHPISFLLGLGAASLIPLVSRVFRPLAVEATVAGMALFDDARRVIAEQMEAMEDIAAEARARHDETLTSTNGHHAEEPEGADESAAGRPRRRATAATRRRGVS
jgi:hypothetical protein